MNLGIIVHSHTGNTLSVAQKLKESLHNFGHEVQLERVSAVNEDPAASGNIALKHAPDPLSYDMVIFAAPVRAFSLSPVMKLYLSQLPDLNGKKYMCFVTQQLPYPWMGGNRAIKQIKNICNDKSGEFVRSGIINWSNKERENKIIKILEQFGNP